jgi:hypothetical protein
MVKYLPSEVLVSLLAGLIAFAGLFGVAAKAQESLPWQTEEPAKTQAPVRRERQSDWQRQPVQPPEYARAPGQHVSDDRQQYREYQPPYSAGANSQAPYQRAEQTSPPNPYGPGAAPPTERRYDDNGRRQGGANDGYSPSREAPGNGDRTRYYPSAGPAPGYQSQRAPAPAYEPPSRHIQPYQAPAQYPGQYGSNNNYRGSRDYSDYRDDRGSYGNEPPRMPDGGSGTYSENEVVDAGHRFFGSLSTGLAKAIQWAFKQSGRPNGYILGEDAGGAFVAGLRYGEGKLYTKDFGVRRIFWQGPSIGYDFGGDGNRTMTLVYNLRSPDDVFRRFGGVQGAAYLVGGVSVQLLAAGDVTLAPIRTGVGLRLGANIGYLKYTQRPTWNPF